MSKPTGRGGRREKKPGIKNGGETDGESGGYIGL